MMMAIVHREKDIRGNVIQQDLLNNDNTDTKQYKKEKKEYRKLCEEYEEFKVVELKAKLHFLHLLSYLFLFKNAFIEKKKK